MMLLHTIEESIKKSGLSHQDEELLRGFLENFSAAEQEDFLFVAQKEEYFWQALLVRIRMIKAELSIGSTETIDSELKQAVLIAQK